MTQGWSLPKKPDAVMLSYNLSTPVARREAGTKELAEAGGPASLGQQDSSRVGSDPVSEWEKERADS